MPKAEQGRITLVAVADPQNRNVKIRPAVIISETRQIQAGGRIACIAVSSSLPNNLANDCLLLPFHPGGKTRTGLIKRSAAMCSWPFEITEDKIVKYLGVVSSKILDEIIVRAEGRDEG